MKDVRFVCSLLGLLLCFSININAHKRYKEHIKLREQFKRQTRSPHEPFFDIYTLTNKSLEINTRENMQMTLRIEAPQGGIIYINVVYLNSTQPDVIDLNYAPRGTYTLYLYNDYIEAEGTFYLDN